jgi:hypothetical protein
MAQQPPNQPGADDPFVLHGLDPGLASLATPEPVASPRAAAPSSKPRLHPLADRIFRPVRLAKFACLVGLSVFVPYLIQRLPQLATRPEYRLETTKIRVVPAPERPVPADLLEQIRSQNKLPRELSLLDPKLCQTLADAFAAHPWVARVISVKQSFPADLVVELEFRQPVAMVQVNGGRIPIDGSGTILPSEDFAVSDVARFPTIRLVGDGNLARRGGRVTEPGLIGAARVAELLADKWTPFQLDAIELPRTRDPAVDLDDILLQLHAKSGSVIIWGRAPGTDHPGELTAAQKLARLEKYVAEFGGFERPNGPYEIDIRHWQEITRRPVGKSQVSSRRDSRSRK